jgi:hypothetical protein
VQRDPKGCWAVLPLGEMKSHYIACCDHKQAAKDADILRGRLIALEGQRDTLQRERDELKKAVDHLKGELLCLEEWYAAEIQQERSARAPLSFLLHNRNIDDTLTLFPGSYAESRALQLHNDLSRETATAQSLRNSLSNTRLRDDYRYNCDQNELELLAFHLDCTLRLGHTLSNPGRLFNRLRHLHYNTILGNLAMLNVLDIASQLDIWSPNQQGQIDSWLVVRRKQTLNPHAI